MMSKESRLDMGWQINRQMESFPASRYHVQALGLDDHLLSPCHLLTLRNNQN